MIHFKKLLALASLIPAALCQGPTVNIGYATYQGSTDANGVSAFLGMRYAAAPTGSLRFAAPQVPANVSGVQQATALPAQCQQAQTGTGAVSLWPYTGGTSNGPEAKYMFKQKRDVATDEDCLFLNVYTPADLTNDANAGLPVIVWIHGGGYISGASSQFNGVDLVLDADKGVVVVTIQYRLGIFGFLAGNEVIQGGGALNAGLLDQTLALEWVQSYVSQFGGDPTKVTIWGESAGAGSVLQHIVANGGNTQPPLFHQAITSSTFLPSQYAYNDTIPEAIYSYFVQNANCGSDTNSFQCLQNADVGTIASVNQQINLNGFFGSFTTVPVIDGSMIIERPTQTLARGSVNGDSLLSITNAHEGYVFVNAQETYTTEQYLQNLFPKISSDGINQVTTAYNGYQQLPAGGGAVPDNVNTAIGIMGESIFYCPTYYLLQAFQSANKNAWKGLFAPPPAFHAMDIGYYFGSQGQVFTNWNFVASFSKSFSSFVISSDPNQHVDADDVTPQWNTWATGNAEMLFNVTDAGDAALGAFTSDAGMVSRCGVWNKLGQLTGQ
ncbi:alpha beta-hydrolase [Coniophora puteana RWD-64-598 SS2]|uniref:Carboxylic ester hydrolase n=1 Tax=Coniophora puteana (strain RWD-64-598) TaxID=741705 RepID=A0A5M3MPE6_CONPW|nr:alpha beta-hydrolase [Coniophora puteana RWD-64-598 SS2]EIW80917.1 alpha beta-hydrolase [Coniophora puteana RWD-64-598 SS2]